MFFGRGICEKYQSRDEQFLETKGEGNLVLRLECKKVKSSYKYYGSGENERN